MAQTLFCAPGLRSSKSDNEFENCGRLALVLASRASAHSGKDGVLPGISWLRKHERENRPGVPCLGALGSTM